jgi:hypothetical protein
MTILLLINIVISIKANIAKESELDSMSDSVTPKFIRTLPHPACLPLYTPKFECFTESPIYTCDFLATGHSQLVRRTILSLLTLVDYVPDQLVADRFGELKQSINKCVAICCKWAHVSAPLFLNLQAIDKGKKIQKDLRSRLGSMVGTFIKSLDQATDIDGLEFRLLCMPAHKNIDVWIVKTIAQRLNDLKRDEIAAHYLLSFARQTHDASIARELYQEALESGSKKAEAMNARLFRIGDVIHGTKESIKESALEDIEMAFQFISEDTDERFVLALVDRLVTANRTESAIYFLLNYAERFTSTKRSNNPNNKYVLPELYYVKAEELGSLEATYIILTLQPAFNLVRSTKEKKEVKRESSSRSMSSTFHEDSFSQR